MSTAVSVAKRDTPFAFIHQYMAPSLKILLGGSILRALIGLVVLILVGQVGPYINWSPAIKAPIEITTFIGIFVTSEVCSFSAMANRKRIKQQRGELMAEVAPKMRGSADQIQAQSAAWAKQHLEAITLIRQDLTLETRSLLAFMAIGLAYGSIFVIEGAIPITSAVSTIILVAIEAVALLTVYFVNWYYVERYKPEQVNTDEHIEAMVTTSIDNRLHLIQSRMSAGAETNADIALMSDALTKGSAYKRMLPSLRKPTNGASFTTREIFEDMGAATVAEERRIRRALQKAVDLGVEGIEKVGVRGEWMVAESAYGPALRELRKKIQQEDKARSSDARIRLRRQDEADQRPDADPQPSIQVPAAAWGQMFASE